MTPIPGIKYFSIEELVDEPTFDAFGKKSIWFLDYALIRDLDSLRALVGPLVINNWHLDGLYRESGLRSADTMVGARYSQHKRGHAFDLKPLKMSITELFNHIMAHRKLYPNIRAIEDPKKTPTWLHVDSRWTNQDEILIVNP